MAVRRYLLFFALIVCTACRRDDVAVAALHRDVVKLTIENATLMTKLERSEKQTAAIAAELATLSERVRQLEVVALTRSSPVGLNSPTANNSSAAVTPAAPHRGGFTDWGKSGVPLPPVASERPEANAPTARVAASASAEATWNDVAKAGDFYDAQRTIATKCQREWPADQRMYQYCVQKQNDAVSALKQGRPFGVDERQWNGARVRCAGKWPDDYVMRVYCEQHP